MSKKEVNNVILTFFCEFSNLHFNLIVQGRAVQTALSLDEGLKQVVHLDYIDQVSPEYQDKLVHLTGNLQTDKVSVAVNNVVLCLQISKIHHLY